MTVYSYQQLGVDVVWNGKELLGSHSAYSAEFVVLQM